MITVMMKLNVSHLIKAVLVTLLVLIVLLKKSAVLSGVSLGVAKPKRYLKEITVAPINENVSLDMLLTLDMFDTRLISYIRNFVLEPPASANVSYNFANPNAIFYSQDPPAQDKWISQYFKRKRNGTFFEAGAFDGEWLSNSLYFEKSLGWTGILMEPAGVKTQNSLRSKRRKSFFLPACVAGRKPIRVRFSQIDGTGSSVRQTNISVTDNSTVANVWCFPIYSVLMAANMTKIDYFVLDLEGFEMDVIPHIPFDKLQIKLIQIETNSPDFEKKVKDYFKLNLPQYEELNIPQIGHVDAIFVHKTLP